MEAKSFRRSSTAAVALGKSPEYDFSSASQQRAAVGKACRGSSCVGRADFCPGDSRREIADSDLRSLSQDDCSLNDVGEFPNMARYPGLL